jgi:hypothetical protein
LIGDAWSDLVEAVYSLCRTRWNYRVPADAAEQHQLRGLCQDALAFSNHFLRQYQTFLLRELFDETCYNRHVVIQRLGQIIYPGQEVLSALRTFAAHSSGRLQLAAQATIQKLEQHLA